MQTARLFANGRSQAVRLPKEYQFDGDNVYIQKVGDAVFLFPVDKEWETFLHGLDSFSDDFMWNWNSGLKTVNTKKKIE